MTNNIIPRFPVHVPAAGFNPLNLSQEEVGEGWRLLDRDERIQEGDGFYNRAHSYWVDYVCRPDMFRGHGAFVHTLPWRRRV